MSKANPVKAVAALLPRPIPTVGGTVRPLSLGMYAILERISSPLLVAGAAPAPMDLVPSLYVLTHDPADALSGDLFAKSLAWADSVPPAALDEICRAATAQIRAMIDVVPEGDVKKKATTAGSPASPSGAPKPTAGTTKKRSGASPRARSRSTGANGPSGTRTA